MRFVLFSILLFVIMSAAEAGETTVVRMASAKDFTHAELHEKDTEAREAQRCFKIIDDDDAASRQALQVKLNNALIRQDSFAVLRTPASPALETGTYRATVRMKVQGMLNSLGSAIAIKAGDQTREVWMNEFSEEDRYQEFSLDFESRPGDVVTKRDVFFWRAPGGADNLVDRDDLPEVFQHLQLNDAPWEDKCCRWMAEQVAVPMLQLEQDAIPRYTGIIRDALQKLGPGGLMLDANAKDPPLPERVVKAINNYGASRPDGSVSVFFPQNLTGGTRGTRGPATPQSTLRYLTVDWVKLEKLPEPDHLTIRQINCRYAWRRPGEEQIFSVWMHNRSGAEQTSSLRLVLSSGLKHRETLWEGDVKLPANGYCWVTRSWKIPANQRLWGQAVAAQIVKGGQVVSEERTWFSLHPFSNAVMIPNQGNCPRFLHPYASSPPATQTHAELVAAGCTIYDSAGVVPDPEAFHEPYRSGNAGFRMSIPTLASMTRGLRSRGIAPFFYLESHGTGTRACEIYADHPDWVVEIPTAMESANPGAFLTLNGIVKENVDRIIDGSLKLCEATDFRAIRWDGLPFRAYDAKSLGGSWGKTKDELNAISVQNLRRFRSEVRARFPGFELRANAGIGRLADRQEDPYDFDKAFEILKGDPLLLELVSDHGSCMEEFWMGYASFGSYRNDCRNYLRAAHFENAAFKTAGGHNAHMLWFYDGLCQYTPDEIYQQLFSFLGGAHLDATFGPIPESICDLGVYATRFSEFFWDPELRPISDMAGKVEVDADVDLWYTETGFEKPMPDAGFIRVIPVINPPVTELWLRNKFGQLPEPIRQPLPMIVRKPQGYENVRGVYILDNSPFPEVREIAFEDGGTHVRFEIPELIVFKVIVMEFAK